MVDVDVELDDDVLEDEVELDDVETVVVVVVFWQLASSNIKSKFME